VEWNRHSQYEGLHAFLSASKYHWRNWTQDKLDRALTVHQAAKRGTDLHALAHRCIMLRQYLGGPDEQHTTMSLYVRDAIDLNMISEQILFVTRNCFGTADTIGFNMNSETQRMKLNIHDLKTGVTTASVQQLEAYAAFFCLEYEVDPFGIEIELRIYQNDEVRIYDADPAVIMDLMNIIVEFDPHIEKRRAEGFGW
jgi:hypothetical protein